MRGRPIARGGRCLESEPVAPSRSPPQPRNKQTFMEVNIHDQMALYIYIYIIYIYRERETVKDVNGRLLRGNEARKRWAEYFEELLNVQEDREADIVAVGGVQVPVMGEENEREITIEEVKRALNETKGGKAPGMDGVRVEMLKEGGVTVLEWLVRLFNVCFMLSIVPVDWVIACMVPLYKGKGDMYECSNFRGISLLSVVGKVYDRVLINRIRDKTENVIAEVQGGFRRGRGCTDQIFTVRQICEKYLGKGKGRCILHFWIWRKRMIELIEMQCGMF